MNRDVVLSEWRLSVKALGAAELLAREGYFDDAVSRAYYATLHAAKAALLVQGVVTRSHSAVRRMFGKHLVVPKTIEAHWAKHLARNFDDRLMADYDSEVFFSAEETQSWCLQTGDFVNRIRRYLSDNGLTDDELDADHGRG